MSKKKELFGKCTNPECPNCGLLVGYVEGEPKCSACGGELEFETSETSASTDGDGGEYMSTTIDPEEKLKKELKILCIVVVLLVLVGGAFGLTFGLRANRAKSALEVVQNIPAVSLDSISSTVQQVLEDLPAPMEETLTSDVVENETMPEVNTPTPVPEEKTIETEKAVNQQKDVAQHASATSGASSAPKLSYGKWSGAWKSGKPNGMGTLTYTREQVIDARDPHKRVAKPGDYIVGEFSDGKLVQGRWFDASNNLKGSIIIGK